VGSSEGTCEDILPRLFPEHLLIRVPNRPTASMFLTPNGTTGGVVGDLFPDD
jgi:hypothetical protein